jgi:hypothetical protein
MKFSYQRAVPFTDALEDIIQTHLEGVFDNIRNIIRNIAGGDATYELDIYDGGNMRSNVTVHFNSMPDEM